MCIIVIVLSYPEGRELAPVCPSHSRIICELQQLLSLSFDCKDNTDYNDYIRIIIINVYNSYSSILP